MKVVDTDVLVIGTGIAGLTFALKAAEHAEVLVATKKERVDSNTNYAQGGVAAAIAPDDSVELHVRDTLLAGAGLCHRRAVEELAREGPERVRELIEWGVRFTRTTAGAPERKGEPADPAGKKGEPPGVPGNEGEAAAGIDEPAALSLGREAGHSRRRILHAADLTGREIERALLAAAGGASRIRMLEDHFAWRLLTAPHPITARPRCVGALVLDVRAGEWIEVRARATLLATGGSGRLYRHTTNPDIASGDGVAIGHEAGAAVANLEFVQFHPTALHPAGSRAFLISEAVRGEGAVLRLLDGETFMEKYHPDRALAPRDVVARAIRAELARTGHPYALLDASSLDPTRFHRRFPAITEACRAAGIDAPAEPIPVVPAAHYQCGGVLTDWDGRTSLGGLYAAGEVSCTGVHGANRLASNSLLEAVVFAHRAARRLSTELADLPVPRETRGAAPSARSGRAPAAVEEELRDLMWRQVGLVRSDPGLARARERIDEMLREGVAVDGTGEAAMAAREVEFLLRVASLVVRCGQRRLESRGLHHTESYPDRDSESFLRDTVLAR